MGVGMTPEAIEHNPVVYDLMVSNDNNNIIILQRESHTLLIKFQNIPMLYALLKINAYSYVLCTCYVQSCKHKLAHAIVYVGDYFYSYACSMGTF